MVGRVLYTHYAIFTVFVTKISFRSVLYKFSKSKQIHITLMRVVHCSLHGVIHQNLLVN